MDRSGPVVFLLLTFMHSSADKEVGVVNKCTKQKGMQPGVWVIGHPTGGLGRMEEWVGVTREFRAERYPQTAAGVPAKPQSHLVFLLGRYVAP